MSFDHRNSLSEADAKMGGLRWRGISGGSRLGSSWSFDMLARFVLGTVTAGAIAMPAFAGMMTAEEARKFVIGKVFTFTCFDGTRGAGRVLEDMGAIGAVQFNGSGPIRHLRLPGNSLQIRGQSVCAAIKGMPFDPCFNLEKTDEVSFRGSVSGMGFAYCDFHHQGGQQMLMARAVARPRSPRSERNIDSSTEIATRVETPKVEGSKLEPVKSQTTGSVPKSDVAPELRRTTE
jgi:hypothetical protein